MFEWQTIAAVLVILAAVLYTGRLAWRRLRSFRASRGGAGENGCGTCGTTKKPQTAERTVFVEIGRTGSSRRR